MEEFLKIKAEELDYLINEREKLDNKPRKNIKDKEDLRVISNLIKELSEQLSQNEIQNTSDELNYYNDERDLLDDKSRRTKNEKEEIKNINLLLKDLSQRLKEMSSRKDIEEYEAEAEESKNQITKLSNQLQILSSLETTLAPTVYQKAIEEIQMLLEHENKILSYNERIISTYNLLKENNYKLSLISELEKLQKENNELELEIPNNLQNIPGELLSYQTQIEIDKNEIEKLSNEINSLKGIENDRLAKYDYNEVAKVRKEIETVEKYLNITKSRLAENTKIVNSYNNIQNNYQKIRTLSNELSINDTKENVISNIEKCQRILPENLQEKARDYASIEEILEENKIIENQEQFNYISSPLSIEQDNYFDNEATEEELEQDFDTHILKNNGRSVQKKVAPEEVINPEQINLEIPQNNLNFSSSTQAMGDIKDIMKRSETQTNDTSLTARTISNILGEEITKSKQKVKSPVEESQNKYTKINEIINESMSSENTKKESSSIADHEVQNNRSTISNTTINKPKIPRMNAATRNVEEIKPQPIVVENIDLNDEEEKTRFSNNEVINVRKPKKNMSKTVIIGITILAASLVLISTGCFKNFKSSKNKKNQNQETQVNLPEKPEIEILSVSGIPYEQNQNITTESEINNSKDNELQVQSDFTDDEIMIEIPEDIQIIEDTTPTESETLEEIKLYNQPGEVLVTLPEENEIIYNTLTQQNDASPSINEQFDEIVIVPKENTYSNNINKTELENAFINSDLITNMAWDEYSAANKNWEGIKEENIKYWTDKPLNFEKVENMDAYLIEQQDDYNNWIGMGYTDSDTFNQYNEILNQNTKGARR